MRKLIASALCLALCVSAFGKDGYRIELKFKQDVTDSFVYLAHCYGKPLPNVYKTDSARVINKRTAILESKDSVFGGMYMILFDKNSQFSAFILNNGDRYTFNIDTADMPRNISFSNSPENTRYLAYQNFLNDCGKRQQVLMDALKAAKTVADTQAVRDKALKLNKEVSGYWASYAQKYPGTYLSHFFDAMVTPEVPDGNHYLEDGKTIDSTFAYKYYKKHYWDKFDFSDSRLINSPVYDGKLDEYFNKMVFPVPDSMNYEADKILAKARKSSELFKYTLQWLANNTGDSKVMGMDEAFVYLAENYYMKGDAYWLDSATLAKYEDRAKKIAPNVMGNIAPDLNCQDIWNLQDKKLSEVDSKYTLLVFWSIDCGHCLKEIPQLDSVYNVLLKKEGVKVYAVGTQGELSDIQKKVTALKLEDWMNVVDAKNVINFRDKYDVFVTPRIYLLDANKKIIGKGIDHSNIKEVIDLYERKKAKDKKS
jgi:thiol-disulfide isomerase/thioredoxin